MTMAEATLQIEPPARYYTMPAEDTQHFITEGDVQTIERADQFGLYDASLACLGASVGFLQNIYNVGRHIYDGTPPGGWDLFATLIGIALVAVGISLFCTNRTKQRPLKMLADGIRKREKRAFK